MNYEDFLTNKTQINSDDGFKPIIIHDFLFDFQKYITEWNLKKGRSAGFIDTGLGKTRMQLSWADNVARHTNKRVLILAPLAVSAQTVKESESIGIEITRSRDGSLSDGIIITNYEKIHLFNHNDFAGVVCDESSILKNFNGSFKSQITAFMRKIKYRLLMTATAAPNDFIELGTSSEALGFIGYLDILNKFFKNNQNDSSLKSDAQTFGYCSKWRMKGHAELAFWRFVCSWALAVRKPSDIGFSDDLYELPELIENVHTFESNILKEGCLFELPAIGLKEQREQRIRTFEQRCNKAAEIINSRKGSSIAWCDFNKESELIKKLIPDSVEISGKDSDESKEEKFNSFLSGESRVLVTKPKIGALGLNFQHCNHMTFFPSHSYEQYYQGVRRCWRFGQKKPVTVDLITTKGDENVLLSLKEKSNKAEKMFTNLVNEMNNFKSIKRIEKNMFNATLPEWIKDKK